MNLCGAGAVYILDFQHIPLIMKKFTKIVATISDKRCDVEFLRSLAREGMNVVRMNSAHLDRDGFEHIVTNVREANSALGIMMDTKGPEIRTTVTAGDVPVDFSTGDTVTIAGNADGVTDHDTIYLNYKNIAGDVHPGDRLLIDDGELAFTITAVEGDKITATADNDGTLGSRKTVNVPGVDISLPALSDRDRRNIGYAVELGVDFIAHSFVRSADDVKAVKDEIDRYGANIKIISKIENQQGVDNFDEILEASYGIMIARGDLGIEVAAERIPGIQLMMIHKCIAAHKPVIVATQMLHSMIEHPRPTRAEVSDVAGAVYQRADAVMLSGETAKGKYPVEAVRVMASIAAEVERSQTGKMDVPELSDESVTSFLARQAVQAEKEVGARAILTDAFHGRTARFIASFRGSNPTLAICHSLHVQRVLALSYGVTAYSGTREQAIAGILSDGEINRDERVAFVSGTEFGADSLKIGNLGTILQSLV